MTSTRLMLAGLSIGLLLHLPFATAGMISLPASSITATPSSTFVVEIEMTSDLPFADASLQLNDLGGGGTDSFVVTNWWPWPWPPLPPLPPIPPWPWPLPEPWPFPPFPIPPWPDPFWPLGMPLATEVTSFGAGVEVAVGSSAPLGLHQIGISKYNPGTETWNSAVLDVMIIPEPASVLVMLIACGWLARQRGR